MSNDPTTLLSCPFCGAKPKHGLGKLQHCQLHGDPYQYYRIWCGGLYDGSHARIESTDFERAASIWNARVN